MDNLPEIFSNSALIWFIIGLILLLLELALPGLIALFFGIGAWVVSLVLLMTDDVSLNTQLLIFIISSLLSLVLLRKSLKRWIDSRTETKQDEALEEYVGRKCVAHENFNSSTGGKVMFKGALWEAKSNAPVKKGDSLIIKAVESIRLIVEPV